MMRPHSHLPLSLLIGLAWRNIWRHRRRTAITLSSIGIGFALAVLSIGLGDGSHNSLVRNAIKLGEGHLTVQPRGYFEAPANHKFIANGKALVANLEHLEITDSIESRVALQVLASTASNSIGAALEGLNPQHDQRVTMLKPQLLKGEWLKPGDERGIIIGDGMAGKLKARIGSKVVLMAGKQGGDSQAQLGRVRGIFDSHVENLDDYLILADIKFTQLFLQGEGAEMNLSPVTRVALFVADPDDLTSLKSRIESEITGDRLVVLDWQEMMPQLVQFIIVDDAGNYIFLLLILIMVVFGILNTVLMSVLERTREFGLLRALGLSRLQLLMLVFCESVLLSLLAVTIGWLLGGTTHLWFATYGINTESIGGGASLAGSFMDPVNFTELSWDRVIQLTVIIFVATLGSGVYPAIKAARVTPVEALRT
ncbi:MAG: ABC transporter permease [Gammaproteobacteria bacterium]|nr:ABC transporter permease [Gammaproteobacteria bacterium]